MTNMEILLSLERNLMAAADENGMVSVDKIRSLTQVFIVNIENEPKPVEKFIFVEDGSVDVDELTESLNMTNPEIKVVVYRQGADRPVLQDVKESTK